MEKNEIHISDVGKFPDKEQKKQECTLSSVQKDYNKYGYLEDYQVEWLLEKLTDALSVLEDIAKVNQLRKHLK